MCELNASQYRSNKCGKNFINDIIKLSKFYNLEVYYKIKKTIDKRYHSKIFQSYIDEIVKTNEINFIDWDVSPFKLIKNTTINISIPFTSTALVGQYYNKPSCYYDPIMVLEENDRATQSVELIKGKDNLSNWIERNIKD